MADTWEPKGPAETVERVWNAPVEWDDRISSVSATGTGVTVVSAEYEGKTAIVSLSGGTAGSVASVVVTVVTIDGQTFVETFLMGIRAGAQGFRYTARDICAFALRKITGTGEEPDADQLAQALEVLNDMLAEWRIDGLDVGAPAPLVAADTLTIRDEFVSAIKFNLRVRTSEHYNAELTAVEVGAAERGRQLVANALLSFTPLAFEGPCIPRISQVSF